MWLWGEGVDSSQHLCSNSSQVAPKAKKERELCDNSILFRNRGQGLRIPNLSESEEKNQIIHIYIYMCDGAHVQRPKGHCQEPVLSSLLEKAVWSHVSALLCIPGQLTSNFQANVKWLTAPFPLPLPVSPSHTYTDTYIYFAVICKLYLLPHYY